MQMPTRPHCCALRFVPCLVVLGLVVISSAASAAPILSLLDSDPSTPGIIELNVGQSVTLEVLIEGVDAATPVNAFAFDLPYDSDVLRLLSVEDGSFLTGFLISVPPIPKTSTVSFGLGTLGSGDSGGGVLARILFEAIAPGDALLALENVILAQTDPVTGIHIEEPLAWERLDGALVQVVPEPSTALLVLLGLGLLTGRRSAMR